MEEKMSQEVPQPSKGIPLIVQYHHQLASFNQQREQAKVNLEQLNGAVFACEHMIKQYEDSAKQTAMDLAKKVADAKGESKPVSDDELDAA